MLRFALFAALFAVVCSIPINDKSKSSDVDVFVGGSITEFLAQNPEVKILDELDEIAFQSQNGTISSVFKWGHREAGKWNYNIWEEGTKTNRLISTWLLTGDRVVEHTTFNEEWEYPQFITIRMIYPQKGDPGATVNMVEIHFERVIRYNLSQVPSNTNMSDLFFSQRNKPEHIGWAVDSDKNKRRYTSKRKAH